jgi:hypothetical protein
MICHTERKWTERLLSIGVVVILRVLAELGILFKLFLTFQIAAVEQDVCSELLFIYLFIHLFVVPGIEFRIVHM